MTSSAMERPWEPSGTLPPVKVTGVRAICTAPEGIRLVVVRVETSEPGLYGLGCATFTQRPLAVVSAVEEYLGPLLLGRDPEDVEDFWQAAHLSGYWRGGPVLNNALSGVDQALWDLKGKRAGLPVYQLLGGKCRRAADVYAHASGREPKEVEEGARALLEQGFRYVRCQVEVPGYATYGIEPPPGARRPGASGGSAPGRTPRPARPASSPGSGRRFEPRPYALLAPRLFEHLRNALGEEVELLHDVHERLPPPMAIQLAKDLEPYRLFFLEDPFAPEDQGYLPLLRAQSSVPVAMGELFTGPGEYVPLVTGRLVDFLRMHLSDIGGLTPARKAAALAELFGVRTAWHGPGDVSPVGHAANLQLDLACPNFGIQELHLFGEASREVFPGCPEVREGALWSNELPGLGIDLDEVAAARYPFPEDPLNGAWPELRRADGSVTRP